MKKEFVVFIIAFFVFVHANKGYAMPYSQNNSFTDTSKFSSTTKSTNPSIKGFVLPMFSFFWFSVAVEYPIKNNFTCQLSYIYSSGSGEDGNKSRSNRIMSEIRYYFNNKHTHIIRNLYILGELSASINYFNYSNNAFSHYEHTFFAGAGIGNKFFISRHLFFDMNICYIYQNTESKIKLEDHKYRGFGFSPEVYLCYMFNK